MYCTCSISNAMLRGSKNNNKNRDELIVLYTIRHALILQGHKKIVVREVFKRPDNVRKALEMSSTKRN